MKILSPIKGILLKRYKRFFSDVLLESGEVVVAHTPNTGPMTTCWEKGMQCILTYNDNPKRKLKYTLELTKNKKSYILVNTHLPNKIIEESLIKKELNLDYDTLEREYSIGNSRFDFMITHSNQKYLIEVKNASTIDKNNVCIFPDTVSDRALKHAEELTRLQKEGYKCILIFFIAREDCEAFRPAREIQPGYFEAINLAKKAGVKMLALQYSISPDEIKFKREIPVVI